MGCSGRVLVGTDHRRVDPDVPALHTGVGAALELAQQPLPCPVRRPPAVPVVDRLPRPVVTRDVTPSSPGPGPPHHGVHDPAVISPGTARLPRIRTWQMGLEQLPLLIGQVMAIMHIDILGRPEPSTLRDTP